jgi:hypothetical protein
MEDDVLERYDLRHAFAADPAGMAAHESPLLNTKETAAYISRSENYVRRILQYEVPPIQRGKRAPLFFFKTDLDRWLATNTKVLVK